ncbi:maker3 [Drosophila busckii]|uniref:Maker3 n=1 Tax=Drosophila busckii TaxID=30019 RepID=A0A0M4E3L2_DROBS|nr:maker3 [Drosophila busckii]
MGESDIETMSNVTIAKYDFEDECFNGISAECLDFIAKLLAKDLSTRMTAADCMKHKWLTQRPVGAASSGAIAKSKSMCSKSRLKSVSPTPESESSEDSTETIEDADDDDDDEVAAAAAAEQHAEATSTELENKELDATKDNLKNFIVRWETHPNSPYVFDVEGNVIAPLNETRYPHPRRPHGRDSMSSSRVCSPSPCESIATLTDDEQEEETPEACEEERRSADSPQSAASTPINESREKLFPPGASGSATPTPQHLFNEHFDEFSGSESTAQQQRSMKSYLHTFDRRNSDTTYLLGRRSSGERVNLADEIRKLSDHLLMLAEINTKLGDATSTSAKETQSSQEGNKFTSSTRSSSSKTTPTAKGVLSSSSSSEQTQTQTQTRGKHGQQKISSLSVRLQQSIEETPKLSNGNSWSKSQTFNQSQTQVRQQSTVSSISNAKSSLHKSIVSSSTSNSNNSSSSIYSESASSRRAKFRINQMSRDVPVGLPDTHQTVNLEEAANTTKDCLLHLLEKYNETKIRNPVGRHQSISVCDWHVSDNLEYRSMSSINAFFQRHSSSAGGQNVKHIQAQLEEKATGK